MVIVADGLIAPRLDPVTVDVTPVIEILGINRPWLRDAACADMLPGQGDPFGVDSPGGLEARLPALLLCAQCPVWEACGKEATREADPNTIRGGMTPEQRRNRWPELWATDIPGEHPVLPAMRGGRGIPDADTVNHVLGRLDDGLTVQEVADEAGIDRWRIDLIRKAQPARRRRDLPKMEGSI